MTEDPLVEEVRSARQKIFEACHEDLDALLDRYQEQEKLDRDRLVSDLPHSQSTIEGKWVGFIPKSHRQTISEGIAT